MSRPEERGAARASADGEEDDEMTDARTTVADLRRDLAAFMEERDWQQFHSPSHLSRAIAIEAAELMEHFLWLKDGEEEALLEDEAKRSALVDELADVLIYSLTLADALAIDVSAAGREKMARNARRFPVSRWRGRARDDGMVGE